MITVNLDKAKTIAHEKRRVARAKEFAPWDIKATIPSEADAAEVERQAIRNKYAVIQTDIDNAASVEQLTAIVNTLEADNV